MIGGVSHLFSALCTYSRKVSRRMDELVHERQQALTQFDRLLSGREVQRRDALSC